MDAPPRIGIRAVVEWVVAAALLAAVIGVGSNAVRQVRAVTAITPVSADGAGTQVPTASVPDRAVSVPMLLLPNMGEIRVGDVAAEALARIENVREREAPAVERGPNGDRQTRVLEADGLRFVLVVEPFERDSEPRIAAIYVP